MASGTPPNPSTTSPDGAERSEQQPALKRAIGQDAPLGMIPRLEHQWSHDRVFEIVQPPQVMVKLQTARRIAKLGRTARSHFHPDTTVITTTTTDDAELARTSRKHEWAVVKEFQPDYHIPADHSTYESQDEETRAQQAAKCLSGTIWMRDKISNNADCFSGNQPEIIPLIKGTTEEERRPFYELAQNIGAPMAVFYAAQYFTRGNKILQLLDDLESIDDNAPDNLPLGLIGHLAPNRLKQCPDRVVASAGFTGWFSDISPRKDSPEEVTESFESTAAEVHDALDTPVNFR